MEVVDQVKKTNFESYKDMVLEFSAFRDDNPRRRGRHSTSSKESAGSADTEPSTGFDYAQYLKWTSDYIYALPLCLHVARVTLFHYSNPIS